MQSKYSVGGPSFKGSHMYWEQLNRLVHNQAYKHYLNSDHCYK